MGILTLLNVESSGKPRVQVAFYPLDKPNKGRDASGNRNPEGRLSGVRNSPGPDGKPNGATEFSGRPNSYIEFPNNGKLDTKRSITILAWIKHKGRAGPVVHYNARGWGVHLWMTRPRQLFVRFVKRNGRSTRYLVSPRGKGPKYRAWNFVGATYDGRSGIAKLFVNGRRVTAKRIGRIRLATRRNIRVGARIGDRRYFKGAIACIHIFKKALSVYVIRKKAKVCFKPSKWSFFCVNDGKTFPKVTNTLLCCLGFCYFHPSS